MNGYKAFYKGKAIEVYADTMYQAQLQAAQTFKAKKSYDVHVVLCETQETGCYIDGYRGQYAPQAMVLMASDFSFPMSADEFFLAAKDPNDLDTDNYEPELMDD